MKLLRISSNKKYIFFPGLIWDGISKSFRRNYAVQVENGIINYVGPASGLTCTETDNTEIVRIPGVTLMPGLVDCHVHFAMNCSDLTKAIQDWETHPAQVEQDTYQYALDYLNNGIVAVRDGSDKANIALCLKQKVHIGEKPGPLVTATGRAIYKKGLYGSFLGPGITTVGEAVDEIRKLKEEGTDQIKVIVSGLISFKNFGAVGSTQFTLYELTKIVEEAHMHGLKVMAHASSSDSVETAILAEVDSVEHGYFLRTRQLELMKKRGTAWVPTLAPLGNLIRTNHVPYAGADMAVIKKSFELQLERVNQAYQMGVTLGIGTDAGANCVPHGSSYHDELKFFAEAGIETMEILKMATLTSAAIIGQGHSMGSIIQGKKPYWCCFKGHPVKNIGILQKPEMVITPEEITV